MLKCFVGALRDTMDAFKNDDALKKACFRNGRTVLWPRISEGRFVKASEEEWASDRKLGAQGELDGQAFRPRECGWAPSEDALLRRPREVP